MKKTKTIAELLSSGNTKTPVEDTVIRRWDDIVHCIANRISHAKIAQALRQDGEFVGNKDNTGFSQAVKRVAKRKGVNLDEVRTGNGFVTEPYPKKEEERGLPASEVNQRDNLLEIPAPGTDNLKNIPISVASAGEEQSTAPTPQPFGDTRYQSDF